MKKDKWLIWSAYGILLVTVADLIFGRSNTQVPIFGDFLTQEMDGFLIIVALAILLL